MHDKRPLPDGRDRVHGVRRLAEPDVRASGAKDVSGGTKRVTSAPAAFGEKLTMSREISAHTQFLPQAQKLHVYGSGAFGAFWMQRQCWRSGGSAGVGVSAVIVARAGPWGGLTIASTTCSS